MSELDENVKTFITCALACWDSPTVVAAAVKEHFDGLVVSRQQVQAYDPTTRQGSRLSEGHTQLFLETRKRFREQVADIGVAHKVVRLRRLDRYVNTLEDRGNLIGAMQALEQAARECGDAFTNTRIHAGPGVGAIQHEVKHTDRQIAEAIVQLLERVASESGSGKEADAEAVADLFERVASGSGGEVGG